MQRLYKKMNNFFESRNIFEASQSNKIWFVSRPLLFSLHDAMLARYTVYETYVTVLFPFVRDMQVFCRNG